MKRGRSCSVEKPLSVKKPPGAVLGEPAVRPHYESRAKAVVGEKSGETRKSRECHQGRIPFPEVRHRRMDEK